MIIDIKEKPDRLDISYVNTKGFIELESVPLEYFEWVECDETDDAKSTKFVNWNNNPIKKIPSKRFNSKKLGLEEFLTKDVINSHPYLFDYNIPRVFSVDIETEITNVFMKPHIADNKIVSISISSELKDNKIPTIVLSLKEAEESKIRKIAEEYIQTKFPHITIPTKHFVFDKEYDMLKYFLNLVEKRMGFISGWNFMDYDWCYIFNRCPKIGLEPKIASPTKELEYRVKKDDFGRDKKYKELRHVFMFDYLEVYKKYDYGTIKTSYSLENVSNELLGMGKLSYGMSLKNLYKKDYDKFLVYNMVDTILVQLIHNKLKTIHVLLNIVYYCKIPMKKCFNKIPQTNALLFREWDKMGVRLAHIETKKKTEKYPGAFVKLPTQHQSIFTAAYDAKSLYPTMIRSFNIGFDSYITRTTNREEIKKYLKQGHIVTNIGTVFNGKKPSVFKIIQNNLKDERDLYKNIKSNIYLNLKEEIKKEIVRRGLKAA